MNLFISLDKIYSIYNDIRIVFMKYYYIIYNVDKLGVKGAKEFLSVDENQFFYNL